MNVCFLLAEWGAAGMNHWWVRLGTPEIRDWKVIELFPALSLSSLPKSTSPSSVHLHLLPRVYYRDRECLWLQYTVWVVMCPHLPPVTCSITIDNLKSNISEAGQDTERAAYESRLLCVSSLYVCMVGVSLRHICIVFIRKVMAKLFN